MENNLEKTIVKAIESIVKNTKGNVSFEMESYDEPEKGILGLPKKRGFTKKITRLLVIIRE